MAESSQRLRVRHEGTEMACAARRGKQNSHVAAPSFDLRFAISCGASVGLAHCAKGKGKGGARARTQRRLWQALIAMRQQPPDTALSRRCLLRLIGGAATLPIPTLALAGFDFFLKRVAAHRPVATVTARVSTCSHVNRHADFARADDVLGVQIRPSRSRRIVTCCVATRR